MSAARKKQKMSPEEYKKVLAGLELMSISLKESKTSLNTEIKQPGKLNIQIKDEAHYELKENGLVFIFQKFKVYARIPDSNTNFFFIEVTFLIQVHSKENFSDDFFKIYKSVNLLLNTWPYFREFVNQITFRMNIPPLTLPFFKTP